MGSRDLDILLAITSGDPVRFHSLQNRLTSYAESVASGWFSSPALRQEAVERAMDKVRDFLNPDDILKINHPSKYIKETIFNSLRDSVKTRKLEKIDFTSVRDTTDKQRLCQIDPSIQLAFTNTDGDEQDKGEGSGLRLYRAVGKGRKKPDGYINSPPHKFHEWIKALDEVGVSHWRWNGQDWKRKSINEEYEEIGKNIITGLFNPSKVAYAPMLWSKFHIANGLIDNIRNPGEKRVMKALLSGFRQVKLVRESGKTKQYISKVKNNYLKDWGWTDLDIDKAQLILYTHSLAAFYKDIVSDVKTGKYPNRRSDEFITFYDYGSARGSLYDYDRDTEADAEIATEPPYHTPYYIQPEHREHLYNRVVKANTTKVYFGDLEKTKENMHQLMSLCWKCFSAWYPYENVWRYLLPPRNNSGSRHRFLEYTF